MPNNHDYTKFTPTEDHVVILRKPAEEKSKGGIFIPDNAKHPKFEGKIVAAGPGRWLPNLLQRAPMAVAVGDHVLFDKYSGHDMGRRAADDGDYYIIREYDILAVIDNPETTSLG